MAEVVLPLLWAIREQLRLSRLSVEDLPTPGGNCRRRRHALAILYTVLRTGKNNGRKGNEMEMLACSSYACRVCNREEKLDLG